MKFNLKNRPKDDQPWNPLPRYTHEKWFVQFEKELREWLDALNDFENHYDAGRKAVLREILGDEANP